MLSPDILGTLNILCILQSQSSRHWFRAIDLREMIHELLKSNPCDFSWWWIADGVSDQQLNALLFPPYSSGKKIKVLKIRNIFLWVCKQYFLNGQDHQRYWYNNGSCFYSGSFKAYVNTKSSSYKNTFIDLDVNSIFKWNKKNTSLIREKIFLEQKRIDWPTYASNAFN